jgi:fluoride exporter
MLERHLMMVLYLAAGGALGTVARYAIAGWVYDHAATGFPWGTFAVNAAGSLLIGFTVRWLEVVAVTPELRGFLTIGLLGGFTTFSTYSYEAVALLRDGEWSTASAYVAGSVVVGLIAVMVGIAAAGFLLRMRTA